MIVTMRVREDLSGRLYGFLTARTFAHRNRHGHSIWKCRCSCGTSVEVASHHLKSGAIVSCGCRRRLRLAGETFGRLTVVKLIDTTNGNTIWKCRCACGRMTTASGSALHRGRITTCGCRKSWGEIPGRYWCSVRNGARQRGLKLTVTIEQAWALFEKQKRRCALTGRRIKFAPRTASFDRIDSTKGYVVGNVQWIHRDVNKMKQEFSEAYFIKTCAEIVQHHQRPLS